MLIIFKNEIVIQFYNENGEKPMLKKIVPLIFILLLTISMIASVSAITGSLGNARMVLSKDENGNPIKVGDKIEKSILVKNVNNVSLDIKLSPSGDLAGSIDIQDKEFTLDAGEEKKAYFTISVTKEGTTESKIDVTFTPLVGKNGVGLSSTIIVIAGKRNGLFNPGNNSNQTNLITIAGIITGIIVLVLVILIFYSKKRNKKVEVEEKREEIKVKKSAVKL